MSPVPERSVEVAIIGSGFSGQIAAIKLRRAGIDDFVILERRPFPGGTWCQNTYPGAAVDVQSPLYSLSFEPWPWTRMYAERDELERYTNHILDAYDLRARIELDTEVTSLSWDAATSRWLVRSRDGRAWRARFVINASGPLSHPSIPDLPGRELFGGASFHTNAWDHAFALDGKHVAIVGSGASAAQVIPAIAPRVEHLHVFQRTPHWVMPRPDRDFTPLQQRLLRNRAIYAALRAGIYWSLESRVIGFKYSKTLLNAMAQRAALALLEEQVPDPALRRALTPDYTIGCKRILLSNTLYPALTRPNVTLHTREDAIARIEPDGVVTTTGTHVALDAIVWATGYDATDGALQYPVVGEGGRTLAAQWEQFPRAFLGTTLPGFPNLFLVMGPNTGIGHTSALFIVEAQMRYMLRCIREVRDRGARSIAPTAQAEEAWTAHIHREMERTVWKSGGCRSWYQSRSGHVIAMYPGFSFMFRRATGRFSSRDHVIAQ